MVIKITHKNNLQYRKDAYHIGYQKAAEAHEILGFPDPTNLSFILKVFQIILKTLDETFHHILMVTLYTRCFKSPWLRKTSNSIFNAAFLSHVPLSVLEDEETFLVCCKVHS